MGTNVKAQKIGQQISDTINAMIALVAKRFGSDGPSLLHICQSASLCSIKAMATVIMRDRKTKDVTDDHLLLAALLCCSMTASKGEHHEMEWSPARLIEAMDNYKKLTGRDADSLLDENLVKHTHLDLDPGQAKSMAAFLPPSAAQH